MFLLVDIFAVNVSDDYDPVINRGVVNDVNMLQLMIMMNKVN